MDRILAMQVFIRVVEARSFVRAADALSLPASTVTGLVKGLEKHLQVRLLNRTTRNVSPTSEGERYFAQCREIIDLIEYAETSLQGSKKHLRGRLRIDMPGGIAHAVILPHLSEFSRQYPDIYLAIGVNDRQIDLVQEGVDCVIRIGALEDSTLVARPLGRVNWITCASPAYLAERGVPRSLEDLVDHRSVHYFSGTSRNAGDLVFLQDEEKIVVPMEGVIAANETGLYIKLCQEGYGLGQLARILVDEQLREGSLVEVLKPWRPEPVQVSILYPHQRYLSPLVQAFTEWAADLFTSKAISA